MPEAVILQWDDENTAHATRHGVSLEEIEEMVEGRLWTMVGDTRGRIYRRRLIG